MVHHHSKPFETLQREVFPFPGNQIIALEVDQENTQDDSRLAVPTDIYVMTSNQMIQLLRTDGQNDKCQVIRTVDFSAL